MHHGRRAGLLLHVSSLPGKLGIGDLGPEAFRFIDQLASARQSIWQILPLGPTGYGDSPYQCYSAFAGNPLLVSLVTNAVMVASLTWLVMPFLTRVFATWLFGARDQVLSSHTSRSP